METTNQIEKALMKKVNAEIDEIVLQFTDACDALGKKYGEKNYQDFESCTGGEQRITCLGVHDVKDILFKSLKQKYGEHMLKRKSEELISKLDLI